jgi:urease accessory protein
MTELTIIRHGLPSHEVRTTTRQIKLLADRATLAKRRWRGVAEDGREFGFDLSEPLSDGSLFFHDDNGEYLLDQATEEVLEIPIATLEQAARIAWSLGNLHFAVQVLSHVVRVKEDPAVLQLLAREKTPYEKVPCVFHPLSSSAHHHHHHRHD